MRISQGRGHELGSRFLSSRDTSPIRNFIERYSVVMSKSGRSFRIPHSLRFKKLRVQEV
jgi:hypothetical protein